MSVSTRLSALSIRSYQRQRGGIMDVFRHIIPQNQPVAGTPPPPPQTQTHESAVTAPNGLIPTAAETKSDPKDPAAPLEPFKTVWETGPVKEAPKGAFEGLDHGKLRELISKNDIMARVPAETMAKIQAGGEGAAQAFKEAMNSGLQSVLADSTIATTQIVEKALKTQQDSFLAQLPAIIKRASANDALLTANPLLANPVLAPVVSALQEQFLTKNPNATQAEINSQVNDVLKAMGTVLGPKPVETAAEKKAKAEPDWNKLFLGES